MKAADLHQWESELRAMLRRGRERESELRREALDARAQSRSSRNSAIRSEASLSDLATSKGLTARETDVWIEISRGRSNADIAQTLNIATETVRKHVRQVLHKLGVENRTAAARRAWEYSPTPQGSDDA